MAYRTWGRLLLTALGVSLLAGAGQLGVAFGFGIVRLAGTFTGATVNQWPAQLVWAGWFAANAAVVGAVLTERLARRDGMVAGTGRHLAVASGAALGATVVAPLCMQPARAAELVAMDPVWAVGICAVLGALAGAGAALAVLLRPPVGWNMAAVAGAVWLLALLSTAPSVASTGPLPSVRLGVLEPAWLDAGAAQRLALVLLPLVALLAGAATGGLARWRGHPPLVNGAIGVAGPVLVAFAYLTAGPGDATDRYQLTPYYGALFAVAAGALGSAAAALLRWPLVTRTAPGGAIEPTDILRPLPTGPALPHAPEPAAGADEPATVDLTDAGRVAADRPGGTDPGGTAGDDAPPPRAVPAHWDWPADGTTVPTTPAAAPASTSVARGRTAGSPPPAVTGAAHPAGAPATTDAAASAASAGSSPPPVTDAAHPVGSAATTDAPRSAGSPPPPVTDAAASAESPPVTDAAQPAESAPVTDGAASAGSPPPPVSDAAHPATDTAPPPRSPAPPVADTAQPARSRTTTDAAASAAPSAATDAARSAEPPAATDAAGSPVPAATDATGAAGSPPPVEAVPAARRDRADEGAQATTAAGEQPPVAAEQPPAAAEHPPAAAEAAAPPAQPAVPAAPKPRRTRKPRSTKQPAAAAANSADRTPAVIDSPADPATPPAAPRAGAQATAPATAAAAGTRPAGATATAQTASSAAEPAPTTEVGPTAEVGPAAEAVPTTQVRPTAEVRPAAGADRIDKAAPAAGVSGTTSGVGSHAPDPDDSGPRAVPLLPSDEPAAGPGGEPDPAPRPAWRPAPAWPAAPRVGPDDALDAPRPAAAEPTPEPAPRPRHRAPLPDLARAANWDALATARPGGPAPTPVDAASGNGTAAAEGPGTPADGAASAGPAEQPGGRNRGRLGLFRRNRPRAEDAPADRESEPLTAQDEEYVDWVAGLSGPIADNEPEQENGRRSLRSTGRHHRD
ncbi:hypothetical protein [Micromonospora sp. NPDC048063]|uniref:hypothetical protein n=1 Tax=Micromonospora sp. NPDC048063 TaxID=3364256 RepID=UPI0037222BF2